jgi:hypothetical protein
MYAFLITISQFELCGQEFWPKTPCMSFLELLREGRLWWSAADCTGFSWATVLLLLCFAFWLGIICGFLLSAVIFSPGCRKLLVVALQTLISLLTPGGLVQDRALAVRSRLAGYRQ